jgi:hypothetical protein
MIKFGHNGPYMPRWKTCWKRYDGVDAQEGILELNHMLLDELFKWRKTRTCWGW